jgi:hypothetical protein
MGSEMFYPYNNAFYGVAIAVVTGTGAFVVRVIRRTIKQAD